jgi:hypothetical protein
MSNEKLAWQKKREGTPLAITKKHNPSIRSSLLRLLSLRVDVLYANNDEIKDLAKKHNIEHVNELAALKLVDEAILNNKPWAIKEMLDRTDGRPQQSLEVTGNADKPIEIRTRSFLEKVERLANCTALRGLIPEDDGRSEDRA